MNSLCLGLLAVAIALQSCIEAAPTNTTTSTVPLTTTQLPASVSSESPVSTTEAQLTTSQKIETTTKKIYDCSQGTGLYPSPYSCSQYYVCVQPYIPAYVFDCPANLWFDASFQQCNYPQLVDCELVNIRHPSSFIVKINSQNETTNDPSTIETTTASSSTTSYEPITFTEVPTTPTDIPVTATTEEVETTTKRAYDCSNGVGQYPSPYSCSQYYVCVQPYIPAYVFDCPANLWYDSQLKQCNYPQLVDCKLANIRRPSSFIVKINPQNETTEDSSTIETTTASNPTTSSKPITVTEVSTASTDIPVTATTEKVETTTKRAYDCSNGMGQYPSPYSCSQYYVCVQPDIPAYVFDCPANLWYDSQLKQCNYPQLVDCKLANIRRPSSFIVKINPQNETTEDPSTIETTTASNSTTSSQPITVTEVPRASTDIPVTATTEKVETTTKRAYDCSNGLGQYPSPYICSQYYVCVQPYIPAYVFDCPANLWYDAKLQQCNYQQLVDCDITN